MKSFKRTITIELSSKARTEYSINSMTKSTLDYLFPILKAVCLQMKSRNARIIEIKDYVNGMPDYIPYDLAEFMTPKEGVTNGF